MNKTLKRAGLILLFLLVLPVLLFIYQPSWKLGGLGLFLGMIGYTISPIIIIVVMILFIKKNW